MKTIKKTLTEKKAELLNKETKTIFDFVKLANVSDKIENKTASKVYKNVISNEYAKTILGTSKIPSFAEFVAKLKPKATYSNWDGYLALSKFNTKNETAKKVSRQNTATAKK